MLLNQVGENIWIYDGGEVKILAFPFSTRMTVVRLSDNSLWVHSPCNLDDALKAELSGLGEVSYLVSPNKLHHLFMLEWIKTYPTAKTYSSPGLAEKRKDIRFNKELSEEAEEEWTTDIDQTIFRGSPVMEEVVFYHKLSKTLILADLIENFNPDALNWWQRSVAKIAGILSPNGKMPIDWRMSYIFGDKQKARSSLNIMLNWDTKNIILSHGKCVLENGNEFLKKSYKWLIKVHN